MRLLLVGAFPYPHHQGSQVYFQEQAIALRSAGAQVELLTYGRADEGAPEDPERWRALDVRSPHPPAHRASPVHGIGTLDFKNTGRSPRCVID